MKKRISWIDIARGLGIISVIYGHGLNADSHRYILYAFHMPLFFFLSGLVFKEQEPFLLMLRKAFKTILLPYFIFALAGLLIWILQNNIPLVSATTLRQLFGILYGNGNNNFLAFNVVLWFLPSLFLTKVFFAGLTKGVQNHMVIILSLFVFSVAGYLFSILFPFAKLFFGIETVLTAIVFFGSGFLWKKNPEPLTSFFTQYSRQLLVFFLLLTIAIATISFATYGYQIDMRMNRIYNFGYFYLGAFSGILTIVLLSMIIRKNYILEYIGKHSILLLAWHMLSFFYLTKFFQLFLDPSLINTYRNTLFSIIYTFLSVGIILLITDLVKKSRYLYTFLPFSSDK